MMIFRTAARTVTLFSLAMLSHCQGVADTTESQALVTAFWQADSATGEAEAAADLEAAAPDVQTLTQWLQAGPVYPAAPKGLVEKIRIAPDGTEFPYVILIPEAYDPSRPFPLEFNLHGGVNRQKTPAGGTWWRNGYDNLGDPERIVVLPAGWNEAFWWFDNQAENIAAILESIKQTYNIDENRVTLTGVSDGGTGTYFFAFHQPTPWAAYLPFIGSPGVLANPSGAVSWELFYDNLRGKPLYIVNGENDRLYPASRVQRYIDLMTEANVNYIWRVIEDGEHNTVWLPFEKPALTEFKAANPRDPLPDKVNWIANRTNAYNRNHWIRIDARNRPGRPGVLEVERSGNTVNVEARYVGAFTLLLSPSEFDFNQPVVVNVNGAEVFNQRAVQSEATLLKWAAEDRDRSMLFTAELTLQVPD